MSVLLDHPSVFQRRSHYAMMICILSPSLVCCASHKVGGAWELRVAFVKFPQGDRGTHSRCNNNPIVKSRLIVCLCPRRRSLYQRIAFSLRDCASRIMNPLNLSNSLWAVLVPDGTGSHANTRLLEQSSKSSCRVRGKSLKLSDFGGKTGVDGFVSQM